MVKQIAQFFRDERGVSAIEYGLIAGLVAAGLVAILTTLGTDLKGVFSAITAKLPQATS